MHRQNNFSQIPLLIHQVEPLKHDKRFTNNPFVKRKDTVASHSWRASLLFLSFERLLAKSIDRQKVYELLTIHDLTELDKGGTKALGFRNEKAKAQKDQNDNMSRFSYLPKPLSKQLKNLWNEFNEQKTIESRIAKSLERLESNWTAIESVDAVKDKVHRQRTIDYISGFQRIDPVLDKLIRSQLDEIKNIK